MELNEGQQEAVKKIGKFLKGDTKVFALLGSPRHR